MSGSKFARIQYMSMIKTNHIKSKDRLRIEVNILFNPDVLVDFKIVLTAKRK
jgi:hypothetical protein